MSAAPIPSPPPLDAYWMPFTANQRFKSNPELFARADGMYYYRADGSSVLDGIAGLWCVNAGHRCAPVVRAIQQTADELDYAPSFQMGHPIVFEYADALVEAAPGDLSHVFFSNSGSEAVDTALKIALAYHRARNEGHRYRLVGRERDYHGVGFGGLSVSGISGHRRPYGPLLPGVLHLPHTYDRGRMAYSRGQPDWGAELADALQRLLLLHDPSTVAAVIVEPVAGSTGVLVPPKDYLPRLREICDRHGILLIFDEVITGFGRIDGMLSCEYFGVLPDLVVSAKGLTNGAVPMGATFVRRPIYDAFMQSGGNGIELPHGYTYSGHPLAAAAGLAALRHYQENRLFARAQALAPRWEALAHAMQGEPHVVDVRNIGLLAAVELAPIEGKPGQRAQQAHKACLKEGCLIRASGDTMLLSPPLIIEDAQMEQLFSTLAKVLRAA
ncbi:MAG: aminotransferase class III-fold pyridoxal phosphate-dependent enzyme [Alcaligenaceae bacterium]|nr:aminotransferase class III-fold pyridoxal phosphate-dependent enzyme [Alcaligenaceae bacterium]